MTFLQKLSSRRLALDIGGTFTKLICFSESESDPLVQFVKSYDYSEIELTDEYDNAKLVWGVTDTLNYAELVKIGIPNNSINITGGGAHLYDRETIPNFSTLLPHIKINKISEMDSIAAGWVFLINHTNEQYFSYSAKSKSTILSDEVKHKYPKISGTLENHNFITWVIFHYLVNYANFESESFKPKIVVNVGSGVSFLKVTDSKHYERVTGTMISGNALSSLWNLVYGEKIEYGEMLNRVERGNHHRVDITVEDIYGDKSNFFIPKDTVASSLGKLYKNSKKLEKIEDKSQIEINKDPISGVNKDDIAQSIAFLISANLSHIAVLSAQLHGIDQICFTGGFSQSSNFIMDSLNYGVDFHSNNTIKCWFIKKGEYAGVIGSLIL